jgi:XTP/dITP diphosphohydrolase
VGERLRAQSWGRRGRTRLGLDDPAVRPVPDLSDGLASPEPQVRRPVSVVGVVSGHAASTVVCCASGVVPAEALHLVRSARAVYEAAGLGLGFPVAGGSSELPASGPLVLCAANLAEPAARALLAAGARVLPVPAGTAFLEAVAVMDRLRSPGGCPWDAAQTHDSLRRYLLEETYELLQAIEDTDRGAMREELGDVLLQVLFHARLAAEGCSQTRSLDTADEDEPFGIDDVAAALVQKLLGRHPHVFGGGESVADIASQQRRWEELKQVAKRRESSLDGVAVGQPSLGLAAKLVSRTARAGLPPDLIGGESLFTRAAELELAGVDPELWLRAAARDFAAAVRAAESAAREQGLDPLAMSAEQWRRCWRG